MINPNLRAKDRIYSELPENLKTLMKQYILSEDEHNIILQDIKNNHMQIKNQKQILLFIL